MGKRTIYRDQKGLDLLAERLKTVRKEQNFTQEKLAYESGLALSQIARIELAQINPTASTLFRISRTLGVKPSSLFDFELPST